MIKFFKISLLLFYVFVSFLPLQAKKVSIVSEKSLQEQARILQKYLTKMYPNDAFSFASTMLREGDIIVLYIDTDLEDESFKIHSTEERNRVVLHMAAGSKSGLNYEEAYQILENFLLKK